MLQKCQQQRVVSRVAVGRYNWVMSPKAYGSAVLKMVRELFEIPGTEDVIFWSQDPFLKNLRKCEIHAKAVPPTMRIYGSVESWSIYGRFKLEHQIREGTDDLDEGDTLTLAIQRLCPNIYAVFEPTNGFDFDEEAGVYVGMIDVKFGQSVEERIDEE